MIGCPPCDAARELIKAGDHVRDLARAGAVQVPHWERLRAAEQVWDTARRQPHACCRSSGRAA